MSREERLFIAIGGADEALLERSERRKKRRGALWLGWGAGLAACLAVALSVWALLPKNPAVTPAPPDPVVDTPPVQEPPPSISTQPYEPWPPEQGETHYLQVRVTPEEPEARFRIYINKEIYYGYEQEGVYIIRPRQETEGVPACSLEISHIADITVDEALAQTEAGLAGRYGQVEALSGPPNAWFAVGEDERYLFASDGTDWDDAQREVWLRPDGEGGVFLLTSSYFMEAAEGHGVRFVDMMATFAPESDLWEMVWLAQLRATGERLAEAVFANDLGRVEDLLAGGAEVHGYEEDVSGSVSVASVDCALPNDGNTATVSVKHRMGGEDAYTFLTMELEYLDGGWKASWIGLEK